MLPFLLLQPSAICTDESHRHVIIGDTAGHIRIWNVPSDVNINGNKASVRLFSQVSKERLGCEQCPYLGVLQIVSYSLAQSVADYRL